MKSKVFYLIIFTFLFVLISCSNYYSSPTSTFNRYVELGKKKEKKAYLECYTIETQKLLNEIEQESNKLKTKDNNKNSTDKWDYKDAKIVIEKEEINNDTAKLHVKMNEMPQIINFKKEKGLWKIDMSKELSVALESIKTLSNMKGGMKNFLKRFQKQGE